MPIESDYLATTAEARDAPTSRARRLVRWLLTALAVLVVGTLLLFGYRYQQQMALIERIEAAGGNVGTEPWGPVWLREIVGAERMRGFEREIEALVYNDTTGSLICELSGRPLKQIAVKGGILNGDSLQSLLEMHELERLIIVDVPNITRPFFEQINQIKSLNSVSFTHVTLPTDAFVKFGELPQLKGICITGSKFDESNIAALKNCEDLSLLYLTGSSLTDSGLVEIGQLTQLDDLLVLTFARISDEGLRHLISLKKIQRLRLDYTSISDAGVEHLKSLKNLKELRLYGTKVTSHGVAELRAALPKCEIKHSPVE